jgi:hypothetical protein
MEKLLAVSKQGSKGLRGSERLRSKIFARSARAKNGSPDPFWLS